MSVLSDITPPSMTSIRFTSRSTTDRSSISRS
jgi:hypothetical protein